MASLTESGLVFAIVGPLRATMMVEEANLDALVRAAHAAVVPS